ncbi:Hypothetical predicted protein [Paramuricea clavata]|uniref:Uncharacterized protein n=1 Tax=Paramuricea clavata TaxID=317549 RepID=A0A7D9IQI7_PARCT|nr:Hypothetical predicted protein [Paramuricea clavata]
MTATHEEQKVCHPIVIVKANGITCRALLDTGAMTSYASAYLLRLMKINPSNTLTRCIQTITGTRTKHVEIYNLEVSNTEGNFVIPVNVTKVDRSDLLSVVNPNYPELISRYQHLQGVSMVETDTKSVLPMHLILGAAEYSKIKTSEPQRTGVQPNLDNIFLAQTAQSDYEELCRMDVLGIQDTPSGDQKVVHEEFLEQLRRDPRLKNTDKFDEYNSIIQDQLAEGVVEPANEQPTGTVFYAMRFHWLEDKDPQRICTLRFTRALFGMGPSPFLLAGVLQCHLNASKEKYPKHAEEIEKELYVDDLVTGGISVQEVREKKEASIEIFKEASFHLHKWQSNVKELEQNQQSDSSDDTSFAKQQLGNESKAGNLLGLKWDKEADTIEVTIPSDEVAPTKRGILDKGDQLWWKGPDWLSKPDEWPPDQRTTRITESDVEVKLTKQLFALAKEQDDELGNLLSQFAYWKALRVTAWLLRFLANVRCAKERRIEGPLTTGDLEKAEIRLIAKAQQQVDETFTRDQT